MQNLHGAQNLSWEGFFERLDQRVRPAELVGVNDYDLLVFVTPRRVRVPRVLACVCTVYEAGVELNGKTQVDLWAQGLDYPTPAFFDRDGFMIHPPPFKMHHHQIDIGILVPHLSTTYEA